VNKNKKGMKIAGPPAIIQLKEKFKTGDLPERLLR
jgi:hypothetical protein